MTDRQEKEREKNDRMAKAEAQAQEAGTALAQQSVHTDAIGLLGHLPGAWTSCPGRWPSTRVIFIAWLTAAGSSATPAGTQPKSQQPNGQRDGQRWQTCGLAPAHLNAVQDSGVACRTGLGPWLAHQGNK